ncbi:hypothetical protein ALC62_06879 [Cyphomyrmex costatus]|uniref:Uncharacterized protein n=1 Tax=Cyphomyrmex costatus TaxID=456900 RepID=A0A151IIF1_9HYME|nr:hypothetical protein ALC62_06879 [Cyphomyrmex costatus]
MARAAPAPPPRSRLRLNGRLSRAIETKRRCRAPARKSDDRLIQFRRDSTRQIFCQLLSPRWSLRRIKVTTENVIDRAGISGDLYRYLFAGKILGAIPSRMDRTRSPGRCGQASSSSSSVGPSLGRESHKGPVYI